MHIYAEEDPQALASWIQDELSLGRSLERGAKGEAVRKIQEWLCLHDFGVWIDGDFGPATQHALRLFQKSQGAEPSGIADEATFAALVLPLRAVLSPPRIPGLSLGQMLSQVATHHLAQRPREVGVENGGPWVRLYMRGHQGSEYRWCAGFVSFCLAQATQALDLEMPIAGSFGCDELVAQAQRAACFVAHDQRQSRGVEVGSLFVERKRNNPLDWKHVGMIVEVTSGGAFRSIEGNTNDEGSANGHEVCARWRAYNRYRDFIVF